ncbi:osmoprotectant ABC transporter substrate-binding protein [Salinicoccus halodurans]|uniref:Glycine/betaine ABC transporter substrate-binding protein n=1 Tax=Salinicoccus halodurans TaxID=407035 RepID=A0A0F7HM39_9STAP|nr:osmoprotectant ABC transporter substrate-binding protein [Salinicoccus halodurans]AKG74499.1 glycine/betaine ABC transporter substrate-binding protein [Salinicoccus halodurans]SFK90737.1 osmoprotectant transport system substrate-binding protein [Salinicoccus halodurans]
MKYFKRIFIVALMSLTVLSGCSLPGLGGGANDPVRITALNTSESQIMAHMLRLLIEHDTDGEIKPTIINNLGASTVQHNAIVNGDANMSSTRYSGTELTGPLGQDPIANSEEAMQVVQEEFQEQFDQKYFNSYGFDNSYAFMVTKETAEEYDLETVSDLEEHKDELELGVDSSWLNREGDGYPGFVDHYGFSFDTVRPMQIGLVYDALDNGSLDVSLGYTTDGRIASYDLVVLEDDKEFFPAYDTSALATDELLEEYPELVDIVGKLTGKISTEQMQQLNYKADGEGREPALVAEEYLEEHNYFEDEEGGR